MRTDDLGGRMRALEAALDPCVLPGVWMVARLDGRSFPRLTRAFVHPEGRKAVLLGDLVDRGPRILDAVKLVRNMVYLGSALCVPGNHDMKLLKALARVDPCRLERTRWKLEGSPVARPAAVRRRLERVRRAVVRRAARSRTRKRW